MHKQFGFLFLLATLVSTNLFGATQEILALEVKDYELMPGQPITLTNNFSSNILIHCEVHFATINYTVLVKELRGTSTINGTTLSTSDASNSYALKQGCPNSIH